MSNETDAPVQPGGAQPQMKYIDVLLHKAAELGASDLHVKVGSPPIVRVNGALFPIPNSERLAYEKTKEIGLSILKPKQKETFAQKNDLDFAYSVAGLGRFRCNIFIQRGAIGIVFRVIPMNIPSVDDLNLPDVIKKISENERGLVLVTGITGSGKSTTLAAMIDYINTNRNVHVITVEDPIEYLHRDKHSIVNQREVGTDTMGFKEALRAALRQDPDVILVGEMRDLETIEIAMTAAETGHLVFSTLHTVDAAETVNRIISSFPPHHQSQIRIQLSSVIKGIISQRLMPRSDVKGRVPAVEIMVGSAVIKECILDASKTKLIKDYIEQGHLHYGMQTFDQCILDYYQRGVVSLEEALRWASNPDDFKLKISGIGSTSDTESGSGMNSSAPNLDGPGDSAQKGKPGAKPGAKSGAKGGGGSEFQIERLGD